MRTFVAAPLAVALAATLAVPSPAAPKLPSAPARPFAPGEVIVVTAPGSSLAIRARGGAFARNAAVDATLAGLGIVRGEDLRRATPVSARRIEVLRLVSDSPGFDPVAAARTLRELPGVIGAAPNLDLRLHVVPNDTYFSTQYHLSNSAAGVHAQQGWDRSTGSASVPIAIIDTGVDTGHPDLATKIWTNPGEIPGNGIDDDLDGYVDDVHGWDFGDGDANPDPVPLFDPLFGIDEGWHGTFVAALAAAASNNGQGVAGIAWNCPVMPLKVADSAGDLPVSAVAGAIDYAIAHGARVVNMSLGATDTSAASVFQPLVNELFAADIVCVSSAGNDGTDALTYPADCDSTISVASTNASNVRSDFSNWGPWVDLCAPGETMWSAIARNYLYDDTSLLFFELLWGYDDVNPYMSNDGTSFSAPVVSGAAALVRSLAPWMTATQVRALLVSSGDVKLYDNPIGPKLNLDRALANVLAIAPAPAGTRLALAAGPNPAASRATLRFAVPAATPARIDVLDAGGRRVRALGVAAGAAGECEWDLRDESGRAVPAGLYFATLESRGERVVRRIAVTR